MPLAAPNLHPRRGPVRYSEEEIVALVEYTGAFGDGPSIPDVDPSRGDLAAGGELYRLNCAACHVASGAGAAIGGGREAPSLMPTSPTEIGEAILAGPGAMPTFTTFTSENIDDVASYIDDLQHRETTAVDEFGGVGPVAEGLAAWLLGLIPLIALTRWIGTPHEGRDTHAVAAPADEHSQDPT
jgi:quinol---cytochrome-c reductase cytochrome c subunit